MNKSLLFLLIPLLGIGQTNTFPDTGNAGIGTTSPASKLHVMTSESGQKTNYADLIVEDVDAHLDVTSSSAATWGSAINLVEGNGVVNMDVWSIVRQTTNGNGDSSLRFNFGTANQHTNPNKVVFKPNGDVGIGTTNPDAKLAVKGDIHTHEVKVDLNGAIAPDYVFKEDYDLKTLEEVESHIKEKGHLPNIPSAKEMEAEGVKLKEMNLKLLEKIEELTLYLLDQNKLNKEQSEKILQLEEEIKNLKKE